MANSTDMFMSLIQGFNPQPSYRPQAMNFDNFNPGGFGQALLGTVNKGVKDYNTNELLGQYMANADEGTLMQLAQTNPEIASFLLEKRKLDAQLAPKPISAVDQSLIDYRNQKLDIDRMNVERQGQINPLDLAKFEAEQEWRNKQYGLSKQDIESKIKSRQMTKSGLKSYYDAKSGKVVFVDPETQNVDTVTIEDPQSTLKQQQIDKLTADFNEAQTPQQKLAVAAQMSALDPKIGNAFTSTVNAGTSLKGLDIKDKQSSAQISYWEKQAQLGDTRAANEARRIQQEDARLAEQVKNNEITQEARNKEIDLQERRLKSDQAMKAKNYDVKKLDTIRGWQGEVEQATKGQREILNRANHIEKLMNELKSGKLESNVAKQQILINFGKLTEPTNALMQGEALAYKDTDSYISGLVENIMAGGGNVLTADQIADIERLTKTAKGLAEGQISGRLQNVKDVAPKYGIDPKEVTSILDGYVKTDSNPKLQSLKDRLLGRR